MYKERMLGYYPPVIQTIYEFKAIVESEAPEFEALHNEVGNITNDAWLNTMSLNRIIQWENILGIKPVAGSSESDRREVIIARIRGQGKLNTALINSIVKAFTGGTAECYVVDSVLHVEITPPPNSKTFIFDNVVQELSKKIPAHIGLFVERAYDTWLDVEERNENWKEVMICYETWNDVLYNNRRPINQLGVTTLENFYLA